FCSPWNTVVRRYAEPRLFLLSAFHGEEELAPEAVDALAVSPFVRPVRHEFAGVEQIREFLHEQASDDPTFEGVVIRDRHGSRWKIKSPTYLGLHQMGTSGEDAFEPKHLLPFILAGEGDELLAYYPQARELYEECRSKVESAWERLEQTWSDHWRIAD